MDPQSDRATTQRRAERRGHVIAAACLAFTFGMVGAAYASVPLYRMFCQLTGYGGTTQRAENAPDATSDRTIAVRFDANASPTLPLDFQPVDRQMRVRLGEVRQASYRVGNRSDNRITVRAGYNVTPDAAGAFFNKIACFCFNDQTLAAGEERVMPVIFFVSPDTLDSEDMRDLPTITLSYTLFAVDNPAQPVAEVPEVSPKTKAF